MMGLLDNSDLQKLLDEAIRERDDAIEYGDCEHEFAESVIKDLHEARNAARFYRDLYVSQVGRTYPEEYRLSWEAEE